ncbi:unnamed protein product [Protopolystoma xenopodis]|uniref:Uncharacterized protein n=1 Tax=Protopolystoma xenopodis TaxID=117903 RepID=A0A3S5CUD2_9PLAT|nr:unnamed protein product [Protopolystoma xenopodis]
MRRSGLEARAGLSDRERGGRDQVWWALLSGSHENPPHSTLASPPFNLVLEMLIRVCHIVTQSSFYRFYQSLLLARRIHLLSPGSSISLDPCHLISATRAVISHILRLLD